MAKLLRWHRASEPVPRLAMACTIWLVLGASVPAQTIIGSNGSTSSTSQHPLGDFIPCLFSSDVNRAMHGLEPWMQPAPKPKPIDDAKAMQIYLSIIDAIGKTATSQDTDTQKQMQQFLVEFSKKVNPGTFAGVMPIDAYNAIIKAARDASDEVKNEYDKNNVYTVKPEDYDKDRDDTVAAIRQATNAVAFKAGTTAVGASGAQRLVNTAVSSIKTRSDNSNAVDDFLKYFYPQLPMLRSPLPVGRADGERW